MSWHGFSLRFGERFEQQGTVVATNAYRRTGHGWKMVIHHASPDPVGIVRSAPQRESMH